MKCFLLMGFILINVFFSQAQQSTTISIADKKNYERIPGATVVLPSLNKYFVADNNGNIAIPANASDTIGAIISATGYITDTFYFKADKKNITLYLQSNAGVLGEVVVTGTMRAVSRSASPVPVEIYTPKFFLKNPTPSIFDALQMVNGVRPQLNCNVCNTGDIHINGLEGPYTMILIDGMPIVSSLASVYGLSGIPNSLVERIEVVKGPASSLYGSEAIGGLINVITKNPLKAPIISADISATSWGELNTDIGLKYRPGKKTTGLFGLNYFNYSNPVDKNHDNFTDVTLQNRISVFNKISWQRKENRLANLAARYVYEDRWGGEMNWSKQFRGGDRVYGENIYTSRAELIGNYQLPVHEKITLAYSANMHAQNSVYGNIIYNAKQDVLFGQLTWDKSLSAKQDLLIGLVTRYTYYDDNTTATMDTATRKNNPDKIILPGIFVQNEIALNEKQKLLLGLRYDYDKRHGNIFTPRVAYKFTATPNDVIRINAGTGFRVVNLFTEEHAALTGARAIVIKEKLKPERSYNINLNYLKKIHTEHGWMNVDASVWYTHFTNRIVPDYTSNADQIVYDNLKGYAVSKGISLNTEMGFTNSLRANLGATFMDVSVTDKTNNGKKTKQRQLLTEQWTGTWTISYTFRNIGLLVDYTGNIYGPMQLPVLFSEDPNALPDPRKPVSPVWSIQNIQFTKTFGKNFEIYGGIKNLLNWTPAKNNAFLIARAHDPFDKHVAYNTDGSVKAVNAVNDPSSVGTPRYNPSALTFDPTYVYAPNQGIRGFIGLRYTLK